MYFNHPIVSILKQINKVKKKFTAYDIKGKRKSLILQILWKVGAINRIKKYKSSFKYEISKFGEIFIINCIVIPELLYLISKIYNNIIQTKNLSNKKPISGLTSKNFRSMKFSGFDSYNIQKGNFISSFSLFFTEPFETWTKQSIIYCISLLTLCIKQNPFHLIDSLSSITILTKELISNLKYYNLSPEIIQNKDLESNGVISFEGDRISHQPRYFITISFPEYKNTITSNLDWISGG